MRRKGQYKAELTLSPRLHVKPLITAITAIGWYNQVGCVHALCCMTLSNIKRCYKMYLIAARDARATRDEKGIDTIQ